jgi:hypothetical protein
MASWIDEIKTEFVRSQIRGRSAADMEYVYQLHLFEVMLGGNWRGFGGYPIFTFNRLCRTYPSEGEAIRRELREGIITDPATFESERGALCAAFGAYLARREEDAAARRAEREAYWANLERERQASDAAAWERLGGEPRDDDPPAGPSR